jgi:hypothetical protein
LIVVEPEKASCRVALRSPTGEERQNQIEIQGGIILPAVAFAGTYTVTQRIFRPELRVIDVPAGHRKAVHMWIADDNVPEGNGADNLSAHPEVKLTFCRVIVSPTTHVNTE